jgi:transcriptional regulator with PAS, ATPase and Fis domain
MSSTKNELTLFKRMLDTLPSSIYFKDIQGYYLWLNKSAINQLAYKHLIFDSIIGKNDLEVFPKKDALEYIKNDKKIVSSN